MKRITMLTDGVGGNGEALVAGESYDMEDASADHWLKRNKAAVAEKEAPKPAAKKAATKPTRAELEQNAVALKVKFDDKTSDDDLQAAVEKAATK